VLWSVQSFDWQDPDDPAEIVAQVLDEVEPGAIVLLHDGERETNDGNPRASTLSALPTLLERLAADGYAFATVSELLAAR
jgi:peptidoglycan/xylan/chitin deacetylase (PgdA/CDA1 family)